MSADAHKIRVFKGEDDNWYWTAYDTNGEGVADSDEGYVKKSECWQAAVSLFPKALIDVEGED